MPRRVTLTDRQRDALLRLPTSQADLLKHYTLRGSVVISTLIHAKGILQVTGNT